MGRLGDAVRRLGRAPARPFSRYFNRRFEDVHGHLDNETQSLTARLEDAVTTTRALQERVATDTEVVSELTIGFERLAERMADRLDEVVAVVEDLLTGAPQDRSPEHAFAHATVLRLRPGARVIDASPTPEFGGTLASFGAKVSAVADPSEQWDAPEPADAAFCMAAGTGDSQANLGDLLRRLQGWVRDDGELVLSLSGPLESDDLLDGWILLDRHVFVRGSAGAWEPAVPASAAARGETVTLLRLRRAP